MRTKLIKYKIPPSPFIQGGENHRMLFNDFPRPLMVVVEGSDILLLTENPVCSSSFPLPGTRYLFWMIPAALADLALA